MAAAGSNRNWQSGQQQCAGEYFCHLAEVIHRADHAFPPPAAVQTISQFNFEIQERRECGDSGRVCYMNTPANVCSVFFVVLSDTATLLLVTMNNVSKCSYLNMSRLYPPLPLLIVVLVSVDRP